MGVETSGDLEVKINNKGYSLESYPLVRYISKQIGQVNIGDASFAKLNMPNWIINDQRGGLGISEMDESVHADKYWWGNCITEFKGHIRLPRLATSIAVTSSTAPTAPTIVNADMELEANWTGGARAAGGVSGYAWSLVYTGVEAYQDLATWNPGAEYTVTMQGKNGITGGNGVRIGIDDGVTETNSSWRSGATYGTVTHTKTLSTAATRLRIIMESDTGSGGYGYFDDATIAVTTPIAISGTITSMANFNSELYVAIGVYIVKLNAARTGWDFVGKMPAAIKELNPSLNSMLYVFMGDGPTNYYYMNTSEVFAITDVNNATFGVQWDSKLIKLSAGGVGTYATTPNAASPSWTTTGAITDIGGDVETLFIGKDADGDDVVYAATHSWLMVLNPDLTLAKWYNTALKLPDHPTGGKGACYWHGAHYISYGLGVKKYVSGSTATITEVGLIKDDGLPVEYNGEIVTLLGESAYDSMFALVDASKTSGNSKSGLYAYDDRSWKCWWVDTANNGAMGPCIISSAESAYALYWRCGALIYYIDIHRGIANPEQLVGTQEYALAGIHISPWFDAGTPVFDKLLVLLTSWAQKVTTTETINIRYRIDKNYTDLDTGWQDIETLNTTGENDENEEIFASGAGLAFNCIQIRLDLARGATTAFTVSPDLQGLVSSYELLTGADGNWVWTMTIPLDAEHGTSAKEKKEALDIAIQLGTLVPLKFRYEASDEPYYVRLSLISAWYQTGYDYGGQYIVMAVKI